MLKPDIDMTECIMCGVCKEVCPEVFIENDLGFMEIHEPLRNLNDQIQEAVNCCPRHCIHL